MNKIFLQKTLVGLDGKMHLDVQFSIKNKSILAIMGKSGAGKTSIIKMIAGLMVPDGGLIKIRDEIWYDSHNKVNLAPQKRNAGFLFQDYALFPNMTVYENIHFALPKKESPAVIDQLLEMFEINALVKVKPQFLSGGQKQRVALARTMVRKPSLLLLDEPFSALDEEMRYKLQNDLKKLHAEFKTTTVLVSHSSTEVVRLADHVLIIDKGEILHSDIPEEVLSLKNHDQPLKGKIISLNPAEKKVVLMIGREFCTFNYHIFSAGDLTPGDMVSIDLSNAITISKAE